MNKWQKRSLVGLAVASALGITSGAAQATALATSILQITEFAFYNHSAGTAVGSIITNGTEITVLNFSSTGTTAVTLNGFTPPGQSSSVIPVNLPIQCLPSCAPTDSRLTDNAFKVFSTAAGAPGPDPYKTFVAADQNESGAPVAGVPVDPLDPSSAFLTTPAKIEASSVASALVGSGNAGSTNSLTAQFLFRADAGGSIDIQFTAESYLETFASFGVGGTANAGYSLSFSLKDLGTSLTSTTDDINTPIFTWAPKSIEGGSQVLAPFSLNTTISDAGPGGGNTWVGASLGTKNNGVFQADIEPLTKGHFYTLGANMATTATVRADAPVPEPGMLVLVGTGLLGLWGARRRRQS